MTPRSEIVSLTARERVRTLLTAGSFTVGIVAASGFPVRVRLLFAWDLATVAWLALAWQFAVRASASATREWARRRGTERSRRDRTVAVAFSLFGLVFAFGLLTLARRPTRFADHVEIWLSAIAILLAWLALNTAYAVHYATLYYGADPSGAGLSFPGNQPPDHLDFVYFGFTLGTAISTSDVAITSRSMRTTALGHVLLAFAYNTGILGVVVNVANLYA